MITNILFENRKRKVFEIYHSLCLFLYRYVKPWGDWAGAIWLQNEETAKMFRANVWNHHEVLGQAGGAKTNFWVHVQFLRRLLHIHRTKLQGGRFFLECKRMQQQNLQHGMSKQCLFAIDKKYIRKNIATVFIGIAKTQFLYMKNFVYQCTI